MSRQTFSVSASTATPVIGTTSIQLLYLFLALQLVDQILLPILIATFLFSKAVKRHPTVINVCMTWIITAFISSLLLYAGKHVGPEPPESLCALQASLMDGVIPMNAVSVLALMFQVNLSIRKPQAQPNGLRTYSLLIAPYITLFWFSTSAAILAVHNLRKVSRGRRFFYCSLSNPWISNAFAIFSAIALIVGLGLGASLGLFLRNNWRALRKTGNVDLPFLSRVLGFVLYVTVAFILTVLSIFSPRSPFPDLFAASAGTALFLFFGTQRDVWRAWFRRSNHPEPLQAFPIGDGNLTTSSSTARNSAITSLSGVLSSFLQTSTTVAEDPNNTSGREFGFMNKDHSRGAHDVQDVCHRDVESGMGDSTMDFGDMKMIENTNFHADKKEDNEEEAGMEYCTSLRPEDKYGPRCPPLPRGGDTGDSARAGHGVGQGKSQHQGRGVRAQVNVALFPSNRFARPGMI